jgi:uncharacterized repeat protein (TIGR02543 family)
MKTRNQFEATRRVAGLIAIAIIAIAIIGCGGDETPTTKTFTVTFHANGGTPEPAQQTIDKDGKATEPPAMTKTNNDFDGWYKESAFTTQWIFATNTVTANVDLYAKWIPYYGTLPNTTIKIYKGDATLTDQQMADAVTKILKVYNGNIVFGEMVDDFKERVDNIHVKSGSVLLLKGKTVEVGYDATESDMGTYFVMIGWDMTP